jgi:hypothetical protein
LVGQGGIVHPDLSDIPVRKIPLLRSAYLTGALAASGGEVVLGRLVDVERPQHE